MFSPIEIATYLKIVFLRYDPIIENLFSQAQNSWPHKLQCITAGIASAALLNIERNRFLTSAGKPISAFRIASETAHRILSSIENPAAANCYGAI